MLNKLSNRDRWFIIGLLLIAVNAAGYFTLIKCRPCSSAPATTAEAGPVPDIDLTGSDAQPARPPLSFVKAYPSGMDYGNPLITLEFTRRINDQDLNDNISIKQSDGKEIKPCFQYRNYPSGASFIQIVRLDVTGLSTNTLIITAKAGLSDENGESALTNDVALTVVVGSDIALANINPENHGFGECSVMLNFTYPIDVLKAREYISITPAVDYSIESAYSWQNSCYRLSGNFKPGSSYRITLSKGLPSKEQGTLQTNIVRTVFFDDADIAAELITSGSYISPLGSMKIPYRVINAKKLTVYATKIYANNLIYFANKDDEYRRSSSSAGLAKSMDKVELPVKAGRNEIFKGDINLSEVLKGGRGAFELSLNAEGDQRSDWTGSQLVVLSDLGICARQSGRDLLVWVNSIRETTPVKKATVKVYTAENQEVLSGETGSDGVVHFRFDVTKLEGRPAVIIVQKDDDLTYLALNHKTDTSVASTEVLPGYVVDGYEAMVFTDRGVYRPGETIHLKTVVRGPDASCPPPFPVQLKITRPDGTTDRTIPLSLSSENISAVCDIPLPDYSMSGRYRLSIAVPGSDTPIGSTMVSVEDFVPPQIKVSLKPELVYFEGKPKVKCLLTSSYLYGGPAAGLSSEMYVVYKTTPFTHTNWQDYIFGNSATNLKPITVKLGKLKLDSEGKVEFQTPSTELDKIKTSDVILACIGGTVTEISGRSVSEYTRLPMCINSNYLGIKPGSSSTHFQPGKEAAFGLASVRPDGSADASSGRINVRVEKISWSTVLRKDESGQYWKYISEEISEPISTNSVALSAGTGRFCFTPQSEGEFRLTATDPVSGSEAVTKFYAYSSGSGWFDRAMDKPDSVEMTSDKTSYLPGDVAKIKVVAPFSGKALFTIESTNLIERRIIDLTNNAAEFSVPVTAEYAPNVHCSLTVIRPVKKHRTWCSHRAVGLVPLKVDRPDRKLNLQISAPESIKPKTTLEINLSVKDSSGKPAACDAVVAVVDEGICMLTDFKTPDPYGFFMSPRLAEISSYDIYSWLMPDIEDKALGSQSDPGGGGDLDSGIRKRLNPIKSRRFKPLALWYGNVRVDEKGAAVIKADLPEFLGKVRVMAVANEKSAFGSAQAFVKVKSPLIVESSLPRFLAPADRFIMPVHLVNGTGSNGTAAVTMKCGGPLGPDTLTTNILLMKDAAVDLKLALSAGDMPGKGLCALKVELNGEAYFEETELPVRPAVPRETFVMTGAIAPGAVTNLDIGICKWTAGTGAGELTVSGVPELKQGELLRYLLGYPHGCLEQTVSRTFPMLYLGDVAGVLCSNFADKAEIADYVNAGIQRVLSMQYYNGSFSLWPGQEAYPWGSMYAIHFLVEAERAGFSVPADRLNLSLDWLKNYGRNESTLSPSNYYVMTYACMVQCAAGKKDNSLLAKLYEKSAETDRGSKINMAAALSAAGMRRDAEEVVRTIPIIRSQDNARMTGGYLESDNWNDALLLSTMLELDPDSTDVVVLAQKLDGRLVKDRMMTTHDNAIVLMAMAKYCRIKYAKRQPVEFEATEKRNDGTTEIWGTGKTASHSWSASGGNNADKSIVIKTAEQPGIITVKNTGKGPLYYSWRTEGYRTEGSAEKVSRGIEVTRRYLSLDGEPVEPADIKRGDVLITEITVTPNLPVDNIVIEDLLPAGLEPENASLKTAFDISWLGVQTVNRAVHTELKDDKILIFTGPFSNQVKFHTAVRAVTEGSFALPAVSAECMYDPTIKSVTGSGKAEVR